ncbi:Proteasome assembly chaperone 2, partial [Globisporangium splendens]
MLAFYGEDAVGFDGHTVVLPAVSYANLGQLTLDLLINTLLQHGDKLVRAAYECYVNYGHERVGMNVFMWMNVQQVEVKKAGHFVSENVPPIAGSAAFATQPRDALCLNLEGKRRIASGIIPSRKITIIQQRAAAFTGRANAFAQELVEWGVHHNVASFCVIAGTDDMLRHDPNMLSRPIRTIQSGESKLANPEFIAQFAALSTSDAAIEKGETSPNPWESVRGAGIAPLLCNKCQGHKLPFLALLMACAEGDNVPDAVAMTTHVANYLKLMPAQESVGDPRLMNARLPFAFPPSWNQLFGRGPDVSLYLIFNAVKRNAIDDAMALIEENEYCLLLRDSAGATPVHIAFLFGHYELGKQIVMKSKRFATLTYSYLDPDAVDPSPYEGENILHIAIAHRKPSLALWLLREVPELINAEATGSFFRPTKACYFGGAPLLFALSSNQINVALDILDAAERLKTNKSQDEPVKEGTTVLKVDSQQSRSAQVFADTSIFMCDRFGNNVLHLAVIHDLSNVYNFALLYAIRLLSPRHFSKDGSAGSVLREIHASEGIPTIESHEPMPAEDLILSGLSSSLDEVDKISARKLHASRSKRRFAEFTAASEDSNADTLVEFLKRADDAACEKMLGFLLQRNSDELTPLSLVAARANERMFQHILKQSTSQPLPRPDSNFGRFQIVHDILTSLPYPLAPKGEKGYKTAIQCLCSLEPLSNTLSTHTPAMERIVARRLEMLKLFEVKLLLQKKWKYVGKRRFMIRLTVYLVFLFFLNVTTLFERNAYSTGPIAHAILLGIAEVGCFGLATVEFMNETNQLILNFKSYTTEAGAGRLDNVCTLMTSTSLYLSAAMRAARHEHLEDTFAAVALIFAWFYLFFSCSGFAPRIHL